MKMKTFKLVLGLAIPMMLAGCAITVYPLITESDSIFDERLLGTWQEAGGPDQAVFLRSPENLYEIEYTTGGETGSFLGRLGYLGEYLVLDVWPNPGEGDLPAPYQGFMISGHLPLFIKISGDEIELTTFNTDTLSKVLKSGELRLPYKYSLEDPMTLEEGDIIITGTTEELRENLGAYVKDPSVLNPPEVWRKVEP